MTSGANLEAGVFLLVDGGGSKTRAVLADAGGTRLGAGRAGPSNLMLGAAVSRGAVSQACAEALADAAWSGPAPGLYCAMAGAGNRRLCAEFAALGQAPAVLVSDAYAAMLGALGAEPGVGIVIGTGTAGFCLSADGVVFERGGWGLAIGDDGSGAWIGRAALMLTAKIVDGQADHLLAGSSLEQRHAFARARMSQAGNTRTSILEWVRQAGPSDYASLAPAVIAEAGQGSVVAEGLVRRAAIGLQALCQCLDETGALPVALHGGLAAPMQPFLPPAMAARVQPARGDAIDGLLAMASGRAPVEDMSDPLLLV